MSGPGAPPIVSDVALFEDNGMPDVEPRLGGDADLK